MGSGGGGFIFCCKYIVSPIRSGQIPTVKNNGGSQGINPKRLNKLVGSGADKSLIQPKKGACLISIETNSTLYNAKKTGICTIIGNHPDFGFIFSFL